MANRFSLSLAFLVVALAVVASGRMLDGVNMDDDDDGGDDQQLMDTMDDDEDEDNGSTMAPEDPLSGRTLSASFGNIVYSVAGFILGGSLMFISLFDVTRKPVIMFFDQIFGAKPSRRRRREAGYGLESRVAVAFDALAAALDKMEAIAKIANGM
ncbi:uncharacterized protein [Penaeus vannamei]|uniref:uncharacterized protein n=1 Tax=Penaeus vannamei TaxID=6689 RepID=UPI00387FA40B